MNLLSILDDKQKAKEKTGAISKLILSGKISIKEVIDVSKKSGDKNLGICMEALEFATRAQPEISSTLLFEFATDSLTHKLPKVKLESARVIGNIAHLNSGRIENAIKILLVNAEDPGTVVRWSAAYALGKILELKSGYNKFLIPASKALMLQEEDNAIRKIYQKALGKAVS